MSLPTHPYHEIARLVSLLTPTELRVLAFISLRFTTTQIAERTCTSPHTVRKHREHLIKKLGLEDQDGFALILLASNLQEGLEPFTKAYSSPKN